MGESGYGDSEYSPGQLSPNYGLGEPFETAWVESVSQDDMETLPRSSRVLLWCLDDSQEMNPLFMCMEQFPKYHTFASLWILMSIQGPWTPMATITKVNVKKVNFISTSFAFCSSVPHGYLALTWGEREGGWLCGQFVPHHLQRHFHACPQPLFPVVQERICSSVVLRGHQDPP